jgi:hypothetical protein
MAISDKNRKQLDEFIAIVSKMDVPTFLGLAQYLHVHAFDNDVLDERGKPTPRDAVNIVEDCIIAFGEMNNKSRREVMKVLRRAVK